MRDLTAEIVGIQNVIRDIQKDMIAFEDINKVKAWLKNVKKELDSMEYFDDMPF